MLPHQWCGPTRSAFVAATRSGDLNALTQLLACDARVVTDGGGKVAASLNVLDGANRAAQFLVGDFILPSRGAGRVAQ